MIDNGKEMTIGQFFDALAAAEYPEYIHSLIGGLQEWMSECIAEGMDPVTAMFEADPDDVEDLFEKIGWVEEYADLLPNVKRPKGRDEGVILNMGAGETDSCMRMAVDYASIFNHENCRRVWVLSDNFDVVDISGYLAHISALRERGIIFRFLLVCPWGWVEIPLDSERGRDQVEWKAILPSKQKEKPEKEKSEKPQREPKSKK